MDAPDTFIALQVYVCEECGHTTNEPEVHYLHLKDNHPYSPALLKFYDKRHFKFTNNNFTSMLLQVRS
jgi:ovo